LGTLTRQRGHLHRQRPAADRRELEHGEAILREHHFVPGRDESLRQQHQQLVRTVAEGDRARIHAPALRDRLAQLACTGIRVADRVLEIPLLQHLAHGGTRPQAILVGAQLKHARQAEHLADGLRIVAGS
jgi:hypothetical protein